MMSFLRYMIVANIAMNTSPRVRVTMTVMTMTVMTMMMMAMSFSVTSKMIMAIASMKNFHLDQIEAKAENSDYNHDISFNLNR